MLPEMMCWFAACIPAAWADEIIAEYQIGDKTYKNVLKLELDTIDRKPEFWRLLIADTIGIIQFDDCKLNKTWTRVE